MRQEAYFSGIKKTLEVINPTAGAKVDRMKLDSKFVLCFSSPPFEECEEKPCIQPSLTIFKSNDRKIENSENCDCLLWK